MDNALLIVIFIVTIAPLQIALFMCLFWFRNKFDKYESIALKLISKYTENIQYDRSELSLMINNYNKIKADNNLETFPELTEDCNHEQIITMCKKISAITEQNYKKRIVDSAVSAINSMIDCDKAYLMTWINNNPFINAAVDLFAKIYS